MTAKQNQRMGRRSAENLQTAQAPTSLQQRLKIMDSGTLLILVLGIPLLWLVGWIGINLGKVGYYVVRTLWRTRNQRGRRIDHPEFGKLVFDGDVWRGHLRLTEGTIQFQVVGREAWPNGRLLNQVREVARHLRTFQGAALAFLRSQEPELAGEELTLDSLDFCVAQEPDVFGMAFKLRGERENSWRVEFEAGHPHFLTRDD